MSEKFVAILMGSDSDLPVVRECIGVLERLGVPHEAKITSAHRTPDATHNYVREAQQRGCQVFICAAGMAAHLAGAVAAQTVRPVIGIPMDSGPLQGQDSLLSTVMMPAGIPVATVAIGKAGARNAGWLAAQILALGDEDLAKGLVRERDAEAAKVVAKDTALQNGEL